MSSGFAKPITIKEAIDNIDAGTYLLPAIQRKFVWSSKQIEVLFDSIMRGYPINSFMLWEVTDNNIKNEFKFYRFLTEYRQFFKETNPYINTNGYKDFHAIIDGQQRLTSIYIGLKGSCAYKLPKKHWADTEEAMPTKRLYLNLAKRLLEGNERQMIYDFQFLSNHEYNKKSENKDAVWYRVNDILTFKNRNELDRYIDAQGWKSEDIDTKEAIRQLYEVIFKEPLINYYLEDIQEIDTVLDIFIRTNSGGQPLSFSDILMSITTASWRSDAKREIAEVVTKVFTIGNSAFFINKDFVLKTCLVLFNDNIKFQIKNFDQSTVTIFETNWDKIKESIIQSFTLLSKLGFNDQNLRAKNAVIPIIYYIYYKGIGSDISKPFKHLKDKQLIRKWLCLSLLKGVFGSQSDNLLIGLRKAIKGELADNPESFFPIDRIKDEFKASPTKNLSFDDDFIEVLLTTQKDSPDCFAILSLIYDLDSDQDYDKDHMHPASYFRNIKKEDFTEEDYKFYSDPINWDGIANLQLLNTILHGSKGRTPLNEWVSVHHEMVDRENQLIVPADVSLDISDFKTFITERKKLLKEKLKIIVT
jgi:uncharacterized protein with ParB-like and HNH nuclease domain